MSRDWPRRHPARRVLPISEWPPMDGDAWRRALEPGDVLEPGGPANGWSPGTVWKHQKGYGRWLTFLAGHGQLDPATSSVGRATPQSVAAYARELTAMNSPRTVIGRLEELRDVLRVMAPQRDWSWIGRIAARCGRREADTLRKRARLRPSSELYQLGVRLMAKAEDQSFGTPLERAVAFRDGLMIAILAARPLRRGSLAALKLADIDRRGDAMWMAVPAEANKARRPIEVPLPSALTAAVTAYLDEHRRCCCAASPAGRCDRARAQIPEGHPAVLRSVTNDPRLPALPGISGLTPPVA